MTVFQIEQLMDKWTLLIKLRTPLN